MPPETSGRGIRPKYRDPTATKSPLTLRLLRPLKEGAQETTGLAKGWLAPKGYDQQGDINHYEWQDFLERNAAKYPGLVNNAKLVWRALSKLDPTLATPAAGFSDDLMTMSWDIGEQLEDGDLRFSSCLDIRSTCLEWSWLDHKSGRAGLVEKSMTEMITLASRMVKEMRKWAGQS